MRSAYASRTRSISSSDKLCQVREWLRRLDDDLVRADRRHAVVNSLGAASRIAFDVIERTKMRDIARTCHGP